MDGGAKPQLPTAEGKGDDDDEPFLFEVFDAVSSVVVPVASMVDAAADTVLQASLEVVLDPDESAGVAGHRARVFDDSSNSSNYADGDNPDELDRSEQAAAVSKFWSRVGDADDPQSSVSSHWARDEPRSDGAANPAADIYGASNNNSSSSNNYGGGVGESKSSHDRNDNGERGGSEEYEIEPANVVDALTNRVVYQEEDPHTPPPPSMDSLAIAEAEAETARREAWAAKRRELGANEELDKLTTSSGKSAATAPKVRPASPQGGSGGGGGSRKEHALVREGLCTLSEVEAARVAFAASLDGSTSNNPTEQCLSQSACMDLLKTLAHSRSSSNGSDGGGEARAFTSPSDRDLQAAFALADVDSRGSVRANIIA